jgi:hypothetical protein
MRTRTSNKLLSLGLAAGVLAACLAAPPASAQESGSVVQAPPPPSVEFKKEPEVILIPQSRVYYVPDLKYDLFRYGRYWYINNEGNWYRARSYRGPFNNISFSRIPRSIARVPDKYHKHPLTRPTANPGITRGVGEAVKRTIGTRKQPAPGERRSAIIRPPGQQSKPVRRTWNRGGKPPAKSPAVKKKAPSAGRKQPAAVKKPARPPATQKKAPESVKKPARSGNVKKAPSSRPKSNVKKPTQKQPAKTRPQKKPAPKKPAPKKTEK